MKLYRTKIVSGLVFGKCQSGKTKKIMSVAKSDKIVKVPLSTEPNLTDRVLLIGIMQSKSTMSSSQFIHRMGNDMSSMFETKNIVNVNNINAIDIDKNSAIVTFHDKRNESKILSFLEKTSENWGTIITIVDEVDQGQESGLIAKINFLRDVRDKVKETKPYHLNIFSTATILNFKTSFEKIVKKFEYPFAESLYQEKMHLFPVEQSNIYYDITDFMTKESMILFDFPQREDLGMEKDEFIDYKEDLIFEKIKSLDQETKKYGIINISSKIFHHKRQSLRILDTGFNVSVAINSEYPKHVRVSYISSKNSRKKTFNIPLDSLRNDANEGYLRFVEDPIIKNGLVKTERTYTGINNKFDITPFDIIQAIYLKNIDSNDPIMARNNIISSYISFPKDFPDNIYLAIVGCLCFDRGNTFQNISTGVLFTLGVQINTAVKDVTMGASNYQRLGRALGNIKKNENHKIVYLTESCVVECAFANASIIDEVIDRMKASGKDRCYLKNLCDAGYYVSQKEEARKVISRNI